LSASRVAVDAVALNVAIAVQLLGGLYITNEFRREMYCAQHRGDPGVAVCATCQAMRPLNHPDMTPLGEGRHSCNVCIATAVKRTADAQPLYDSVLAWYRDQGMDHAEKPPLAVVLQSEMTNRSGRIPLVANAGDGISTGEPVTHLAGLCCFEGMHSLRAGSVAREMASGGLWSKEGRKRLARRAVTRHVTDIWLLDGLARLMAGSVLAHELMHAWLRMEGYRQLQPMVEEGLCQLMAYLWLLGQPVEVRHDCAAALW
jgi:Protein DA1